MFMIKKILNFRLQINFILIFFIFFIQSGYSNFFNGIPFSNKYETILLFIILPLIFIFNINIFKKKIACVFIFLIFLLKLILIFFNNPQGLSHQLYLKGENELITSYHSFWKKNSSDFQEFNWSKKEYFPLDKFNYDNNYNKIPAQNLNSNDSFIDLNINDKVTTYYSNNKDKKFKFFFEGIKDSNLIFFDKNNNIFKNVNFLSLLLL